MRIKRQKAKNVMLGKWFFNITFLLFAFSSPVIGQTGKDPTQKNLIEQNLEEGRRLLSEGNFTAAIAAFNRHKQTSPADARAYFHAGLALIEAGRLSDAALELDEALRLDPQRLEYLILQASLFARLKQRTHAEQALAILSRLGTTERLEVSWLWMLSDVYYRLERFNDALRILEQLGKRNPDDPRLDLNRGQALVLSGEFDHARQSFEKSIAKHPGNPITHFELGNLLYQQSKLPGAKSSLLKAVRLDKNNPAYHYKLGTVCLALGEIDEALTHLLRAVALDPAGLQAYFALGQAYQRKGQQQKSLEFRKKYQELSIAKQRKEVRGEELDRLLARGERLLDEGKETEARAAFEQLIQTTPDHWTAHAYLAEMYLAAADWQKAWPHLEKMEASEPDSVVGNYLMARHWYLRHDFERARMYAEKVKQSRPAHADLRNLLGQIYLGLGQSERSQREFEEAVRLAPGRADFRANLSKLKNQ
jgi:tetratricopeptide (TPR) repeat protein